MIFANVELNASRVIALFSSPGVGPLQTVRCDCAAVQWRPWTLFLTTNLDVVATPRTSADWRLIKPELPI
jgi:hypothetical protein